MQKHTQPYWTNDVPPSRTREWLLPPTQRSQRRSDPSDRLYDSRENPGGIGFPSCSRELALPLPNLRDPHGYYRSIGVSPSATHREIRSTVRRLLRKHHPDTGDGDTAKFQRVRLIGEVLLDETARAKYDHTPPGMRLMDAVYYQEILDANLDPLTHEFIADSVRPAHVIPRMQGRYDFFAIDHTGGDSMLANMWYHHLIRAAGPCGYRTVLKVCLTDSHQSGWTGSIMVVPRFWEPTPALAEVLFRRAGFNPPD